MSAKTETLRFQLEQSMSLARMSSLKGWWVVMASPLPGSVWEAMGAALIQSLPSHSLHRGYFGKLYKSQRIRAVPSFSRYSQILFGHSLSWIYLAWKIVQRMLTSGSIYFDVFLLYSAYTAYIYHCLVCQQPFLYHCLPSYSSCLCSMCPSSSLLSFSTLPPPLILSVFLLLLSPIPPTHVL